MDPSQKLLVDEIEKRLAAHFDRLERQFDRLERKVDADQKCVIPLPPPGVTPAPTPTPAAARGTSRFRLDTDDPKLNSEVGFSLEVPFEQDVVQDLVSAPRPLQRAPLRPPLLRRQRRPPLRPPLLQQPWRAHRRPIRLHQQWRAHPRCRPRRAPPRQARLRRPRRAPLRRRERPPRLLLRVRGRRPRLRVRARALQPRLVLRRARITSCSTSAVVNLAPIDERSSEVGNYDPLPERHAVIVRAEGLGASGRVFNNNSATDDPDLLRCVCLDHAVVRGHQSLAAAAALHADAIGAAGGGLVAWVVAVAPAQTNCSTVCPAGERCFADVPVGTLWVEEKLRGGTCTNARPDPLDAVKRGAKHLVHGNDFADQLERGEEALCGDALQLRVSLARTDAVPESLRQLPGDRSVYILTNMNIVLVGAEIVYVLTGGLLPAMATNGSHGMASSAHATEATPTSSPTSTLPGASTPSLAMMISISVELASLGARQVFEVLSLHADLFCNTCIGLELPSHMSVDVDQHHSCPLSDLMRFMSFDAELRPLPWLSVSMIERCSVCWYVRLWKSQWFPSLWKLVRCVPAPALQKLLSCMMVLSVSVAGCALNQEVEQRKCGGTTGQWMAMSLLHILPIGPAAPVHLKIVWSVGTAIGQEKKSKGDNRLQLTWSSVTSLVFIWRIHVAVMLPVLGQRFGILTSSILPQLPWMSFDPGPLFKLKPLYNSKGDLQCTLLLFLDSRSLQRVIHTLSLKCLLSGCPAQASDSDELSETRIASGDHQSATVLSEFLTCLMISVSIVACGLILKLAQQKCGVNCWCFLLEGSQLKDVGENSECLELAGTCPDEASVYMASGNYMIMLDQLDDIHVVGLPFQNPVHHALFSDSTQLRPLTFELHSISTQLIKYAYVHFLPSALNSILASLKGGNHLKLALLVLVYRFYSNSMLLHQFTTTVQAPPVGVMRVLVEINYLAHEEFQFISKIQQQMVSTIIQKMIDSSSNLLALVNLIDEGYCQDDVLITVQWQLLALVEFTDDALNDIVLADSTMQHVLAPPAPPKHTGRIEMQMQQNKKRPVISQFPWDTGDSDLLRRLEGKPKLKKGGMSGMGCRMGLGPWPCRVLSGPRLPDVIYKSAGAATGERIDHFIRNRILLPPVTVHLPPQVFSLFLPFLHCFDLSSPEICTLLPESSYL